MSNASNNSPPNNPPPKLAEAMKAGMRHLASGVSVVATRDSSGNRHAMTVTSITSVSDAPPSILVCLNDVSMVAQSLDDTHFFSASLLSEQQQGVSEICSRTPEGQDRFDIGDWQLHGATGTPYLHDGLASFICRIQHTHRYGTHWIVVGDVEEAIINSVSDAPLVYCRGGYASLK